MNNPQAKPNPPESSKPPHSAEAREIKLSRETLARAEEMRKLRLNQPCQSYEDALKQFASFGPGVPVTAEHLKPSPAEPEITSES